MTTPHPSPGTQRQRVHAVRWLALSLLAVVAFVAVPPLLVPVARDNPDLPAAAAAAVTSSWSIGMIESGGVVQALLDGWRDYHWAKAVLALLGVVAFVRLATVLPGRHWVARWVCWGGALLAVLLVMANIQGALAPLASLLSLLPVASGGEYGTTLSALAADVSGGVRAPVTAAIVKDFAWFHALFAVMAAVLGLGLMGCGGGQAMRVSPGRPGQWFAALAGTALGLGALVIAAANVATALAPAPALQSFLDGLIVAQ